MDQGLSKRERLCSRKAVETLVASGRYVYSGPIRCRYVQRDRTVDRAEVPAEDSVCRIMVSVPKRHFKRAVKRNLLKRRIREAYRLQKGLLEARNDIDMMFVYTSREICGFEDISVSLQHILKEIASAQ